MYSTKFKENAFVLVFNSCGNKRLPLAFHAAVQFMDMHSRWPCWLYNQWCDTAHEKWKSKSDYYVGHACYSPLYSAEKYTSSQTTRFGNLIGPVEVDISIHSFLLYNAEIRNHKNAWYKVAVTWQLRQLRHSIPFHLLASMHPEWKRLKEKPESQQKDPSGCAKDRRSLKVWNWKKRPSEPEILLTFRPCEACGGPEATRPAPVLQSPTRLGNLGYSAAAAEVN